MTNYDKITKFNESCTISLPEPKIRHLFIQMKQKKYKLTLNYELDKLTLYEIINNNELEIFTSERQ